MTTKYARPIVKPLIAAIIAAAVMLGSAGCGGTGNVAATFGDRVYSLDGLGDAVKDLAQVYPAVLGADGSVRVLMMWIQQDILSQTWVEAGNTLPTDDDVAGHLTQDAINGGVLLPEDRPIEAADLSPGGLAVGRLQFLVTMINSGMIPSEMIEPAIAPMVEQFSDPATELWINPRIGSIDRAATQPFAPQAPVMPWLVQAPAA